MMQLDLVIHVSIDIKTIVFTQHGVCVCLFPSAVEASLDGNKTIDVMPEIRPAMLC